MKKGIVYCFVLVLSLLQVQIAAADGVPYVEPAGCPIDVPGDREIECGVLVAPENYTKPDGAVVRLPYIYVHSTSPNPDPTPVLFTEGGPGYSSLPQVWGVGRSMLADERDVIIFEQRGNRYAHPALMCEYEEIADFDGQASPCLDRILAQGVDITQYTTAVIAEDIESLRILMGIEQWNLYGTSYSTRLMQVLMAKHPEGIRSVILQSVNVLHETRYQNDPAHSNRALQQMFTDCAAIPECAAGYPNLEEDFTQAVTVLNENPLNFKFSRQSIASEVDYIVDGDKLISWMVGDAFYGPAFPHYDTAYLPMLIEAALDRNTTVLYKWAERQFENDIFLSENFSYGVYFGVNCQDDASSVTEEQYKAQIPAFPKLDGFSRHYEEYRACQVWGLPPAAPLADAPIKSDIPTLVLAGSYDPITPPEWSQTVAENLSNAFYVEFPSKGHSLDVITDCPMQIKKAFLRDPWTAPDTSCVSEEPPVGYVLPGEVITIPDYAKSWDDINFGLPQGNPAIETVAGITLILFFLAVVVALVVGLVVLFSRRGRQVKQERYNLNALLLAALVAVLSIAVVILMSLFSQADVTLQRVTLIFGCPADYPYLMPLGIVVYLQMISALVLLMVTVRIWRKVRGTVLSRVSLALTTLAAFTFWPFYFRWDLTDILWQLLK